MKYHIRHVTSYQYDSAVTQCHNSAYLVPRDTLSQKLISNRLSVSPRVSTQTQRQDYFGNHHWHFSVDTPHTELEVTAVSEIETFAAPNLAFEPDITCAQAKETMLSLKSSNDIEASEFLHQSPMIQTGQEFLDLAADLFNSDVALVHAVGQLNHRIFDQFDYASGFSNVATPLYEVLKHRKGVCQDFAHLAIACLRSLGFPARYVSGYLETIPPPGVKKLQGSDASHAWFSVYIPNEGWIDFDPTNDMRIGEQHITTAWGRDYSDVTPLKGVVFGGGRKQTISVAVDVERV